MSVWFLNAQENSISLHVKLDDKNDLLKIQEKIVYHNNTDSTLQHIYLHDWANSYRDRRTPLGKRFLEDYSRTFYFSEKKERGNSIIHNLSVDYQRVDFYEVINHPDVLKITLNNSLKPNDSAVITTYYTIKIPSAKFTNYGKTSSGYHLRFWYLVPAVFKNGWQTMSNLNMDDLYMDVANYNIKIDAQKKYFIESNLTKTTENNTTFLSGKNQKDVIINFDTINRYKTVKTSFTTINTDILDKKLDNKTAEEIIEKQLDFIHNYLGEYPNKNLFVDWNSVGKNSLHEIYGLPDWLKPFPENFKWEMQFFKALTIKYIDDVLLFNKRKDYWLSDGIQTFLMMEYIKKHYEDVAILGKYSKWWLVRSYNISKLKHNDKYPFVYQFSARKFYDQALNTRSDSLSNFNRKIISKYKAGLGMRYLQDFIGDSILQSSIKEFYAKNQLQPTTSKKFQDILTSKTNKDLRWFFGDYVQTNKKIDYKISNVQQTKDSLNITIKNKRNTVAPVALYGIKDKQIKFKQWVTNVDSTKTVTIAKNGFDKLALNFEQLYPEYNSLDNFTKVKNSFFKKPLQFRLYKDVGDPYYTQLFLKPNVKYNLYDGLIFGLNINNKPMLARNFVFSVTPNYSTKSNNFTGSFGMSYSQFFRKTNIYKITYGVGGSNFHYAPELGYNTFTPSVTVEFKRNSLRDVGYKYFQSRLIYIDKEIPDSIAVSEEDKYRVLNFRYVYNKPNIVERFQYALNTEFADNFSKFSTDIRYRKEFTKTNSIELRFFGGVFFHNDSEGDYFSFGLNRGSDYLFEKSLFGRSEKSGLFSQQFVIADGGFKSRFNQDSFANQLITSANTSIGVWKWLEIYNDAALLKNRHEKPRFFYENGVRFNFIPQIFEFYFPIYTNQGSELNGNYGGKIRFVITTSLDRIYNYIRRGLL